MPTAWRSGPARCASAISPNAIPDGFYTGDTAKHPGAGLQQDYYELGGKNADGNDGFKQNRPGWPVPIHRLRFQYKLNIVFP
jgi:hypothetical protein